MLREGVDTAMEKVELGLTPIEITFLARLFGVRELRFIGDPFFGWLSEEVAEAWVEARDSLSVKGMIKVDPVSGEVVVDLLAAAALAVLTLPERTYVLASWDYEGKAVFKVAHLTSGISLLYEILEDPYQELRILVFFSPGGAVEQIRKEINIRSSGKTGARPFLIEVRDFWNLFPVFARERAVGVEGKEDLWGSAGDSGLSRMLGGKFNLSFLAKAFDRDATSEVRVVGFLCGERSLWSLEPRNTNGREYYFVEPVGEEVARSKLDALLSA